MLPVTSFIQLERGYYWLLDCPCLFGQQPTSLSLLFASGSVTETHVAAFYVIACNEFWAEYCVLSNTHCWSWWSHWEVMVASHCHSWWRWWPDTLWVRLRRLWPHSCHGCFGLGRTDTLKVNFEVFLWSFLCIFCWYVYPCLVHLYTQHLWTDSRWWWLPSTDSERGWWTFQTACTGRWRCWGCIAPCFFTICWASQQWWFISWQAFRASHHTLHKCWNIKWCKNPDIWKTGS